MKTKIMASLIALMWIITFTNAWDLSSFVVEINPATVKTWEPTDISVKAIDAAWDIIEDYQWDVMFMVNNNDWSNLDTKEFVVPNEWMYTFKDTDMWKATFTKWLIVNKAWEFKVKVDDFETWNSWTATIKVLAAWAEIKWEIKIISPQNQEVITDSTVSVVWTSADYKNSKIIASIDGKPNGEWLIDSAWNYKIDLNWVANGEHKLKIEVLDLDWNVIISSEELSITVNANVELYNGLEILPWKELPVWTEATINVKVDPSVSSATLKIQEYWEYPMDRKTTDEFTTQVNMNKAWKFDISVDLTADGSQKSFDKVSEIVALDKVAIHSVKFVRDNSEQTISLDWKFTWEVPSFKIEYGTSTNTYPLNASVDENKFKISKINETDIYYVKISPIDSNWNVIWEPSAEIVVEPDMKKSATCMVDNIKTTVVASGSKNYLTWDVAEWAVKYVVFKWDNAKELSSVAELTWTSYELPYNPDAKKTEYAYFAVKAVCDDWSMKQIDKVKKVKVWPMDVLLYAIMISIVLYGLRLATRNLNS